MSGRQLRGAGVRVTPTFICQRRTDNLDIGVQPVWTTIREDSHLAPAASASSRPSLLGPADLGEGVGVRGEGGPSLSTVHAQPLPCMDRVGWHNGWGAKSDPYKSLTGPLCGCLNTAVQEMDCVGQHSASLTVNRAQQSIKFLWAPACTAPDGGASAQSLKWRQLHMRRVCRRDVHYSAGKCYTLIAI